MTEPGRPLAPRQDLHKRDFDLCRKRHIYEVEEGDGDFLFKTGPGPLSGHPRTRRRDFAQSDRWRTAMI